MTTTPRPTGNRPHKPDPKKSPMSITIKFFASLREQFGIDEVKLDTPPTTVGEAWSAVTDKPRPNNTLAAVNHEYVAFDHPIEPGDEVAFFPPVTGG